MRGASPFPTPLDDGAIAALRSLADPDGIIRPRRALAARFRAGDQVRVQDGPWAGLIGEVLTMRGPERARLLFGTLKADIAVRSLGAVAEVGEDGARSAANHDGTECVATHSAVIPAKAGIQSGRRPGSPRSRG